MLSKGRWLLLLGSRAKKFRDDHAVTRTPTARHAHAHGFAGGGYGGHGDCGGYPFGERIRSSLCASIPVERRLMVVTEQAGHFETCDSVAYGTID